MKLLVEFTLDDSWEAYFATDQDRLSALVNLPALDGVETRIVKEGEITDKQHSEMREALKDIIDRYPNSPWIIDRLKSLLNG